MDDKRVCCFMSWVGFLRASARIHPLFGLVLAFALLGVPAPDAAAQISAVGDARTALTIGRISGNPRKHAGRLSAFGEYLVHRLQGYGPTETDIVLSANPGEILDAAARGDIDLISETVFAAAQLEETGAMEIALVEWKRNVRRYRSALIVRKDSDIETLDDLRGRTVAFEDRGSTSGFFLPYLAITDAGLELWPLDERNQTADAVRYSFAGTEVNVVGSVVRARADTGAISETDLNDPEVMTARFKSQVRVVHLTPFVPRSTLLMRKTLAPTLKSKLLEILLTMHTDAAGREVLDRYFKVGRYAEIDAQARRELDRIRAAVRQRQGIL